MKLIALPAFLTLAALLGGHEAARAATVSSSATLSDFRITLLDLNLDDGIAPAIHFGAEGEPPSGGSTSGGIIFRSLANGDELYNDYYNNSGPVGPFSSAFGSASQGGTSVSSSLVAGADRLGPHTFTVQGSATAAAGTQATYQALVLAPGIFSLSYLLTPHTLVRFDGTISLYAAINGPASDQDSATASFDMSAYGVGPSAGEGSSQYSRDRTGVTVNGPRPSRTLSSRSLSRAVGVSLLNNSSGDISGQLVANVHVNGMTSAVPEVSAAWLALVGGGVVGARVGQRRARIAKRACTNSKA
ncbi:MAG: hypothetical protein EOP38_01910 [Rubrivivax sp.]|nr:MAG: hypothetical protein EOP38_01910 [Rubrivivax sp.]